MDEQLRAVLVALRFRLCGKCDAPRRGGECGVEVVDLWAAALREIGTAAAAPAERLAGFAQEDVHVAGRIGRAGED